MNEKRQIAAVFKELQKHERQEDAKAQREELIKAIAEATSKEEVLVRRKLAEVKVREEARQGICIVVGIVAAILAFAFGVAFLEVNYFR